MKNLGLIGSSGKMGQQVIEVVASSPWKESFKLAAEITSKTQKVEIALPLDVIVDFSNAKSTLSWIDFVAEKKIPYLICSTGFSTEEFALLKQKLGQQAWAYIPNTSLGVFAFIHTLCALVTFFKDIQSIEIHDVHHVHKKDSPSGTALLIQAALMTALKGKSYPGDIHIKSSREGEVVGIHTVIIQRKFDRLILTHEAQDRKLFAEGALLLAEKLSQKSPRERPYSFDELL